MELAAAPTVCDGSRTIGHREPALYTEAASFSAVCQGASFGLRTLQSGHDLPAAHLPVQMRTHWLAESTGYIFVSVFVFGYKSQPMNVLVKIPQTSSLSHAFYDKDPTTNFKERRFVFGSWFLRFQSMGS